tara:strand:+ start:49103 stop:49645 length:543 start_codon:yes stop_codon:yes gene_type:complete
MKNLFLFGLFFSLNMLFSQQAIQVDSLKTDTILRDTFSIKRDKLPGEYVEYVDSFYYATEALQKKINFTKCPQLVDGYRVQIFSCSGEGCKEKANKYYSQFLIAFPTISAYKMWQAPTIKVRAGDCRNRFEAEKIKNQIKDDFPFVFIVPDHIESPYKIDCDDMKISKSDSILILPLRNK